MKKTDEDKTILKWRLHNLPTVEEAISLTEAGLLSKEEARELLLKEENAGDKLSQLQDEVKVLKETIKKLAAERPMTVYVPQTYQKITPTIPGVTWSSGVSTSSSLDVIW